MARKIKVRLILQLDPGGLSRRDIAACGMSRSSVSTVLRIARKKNITYEDVKDITDEELKSVGVTLYLLYKEYCDLCREKGTIAVGLTKFFDDYNKFCAVRNITNHLDHKPGERCEVDWSGPTTKLVNSYTGEAATVYLFVACLIYSRFAYVEPTLDMKMDNWIRCHVHMYEAFGGVPVRTVCDT